jgi:hypothetical protein
MVRTNNRSRCCFQCDLVYEAKPLPTFASWQVAEYIADDNDVAIPESPLFCPRPDYVTVPTTSDAQLLRVIYFETCVT